MYVFIQNRCRIDLMNLFFESIWGANIERHNIYICSMKHMLFLLTFAKRKQVPNHVDVYHHCIAYKTDLKSPISRYDPIRVFI